MTASQLTAILSIFATILALVASPITAVINNYSAYKLQSSQLFFNAKLEAYKTFISLASSTSYPLSSEAVLQLSSANSQVMILSGTRVNNATSIYYSELLRYPASPSKDEMAKLANAKIELIIAMQEELKEFL